MSACNYCNYDVITLRASSMMAHIVPQCNVLHIVVQFFLQLHLQVFLTDNDVKYITTSVLCNVFLDSFVISVVSGSKLAYKLAVF